MRISNRVENFIFAVTNTKNEIACSVSIFHSEFGIIERLFEFSNGIKLRLSTTKFSTPTNDLIENGPGQIEGHHGANK